jgi:hypothetical protein
MPLATLTTTVATVSLLASAHAVTLPLHTAQWSGFKPAVELDGEFGNEGGSPLDLGGVFATVSVGSQEFHVHIDTGSSMLIIPAARSQCPTCPPTQRAVGARHHILYVFQVKAGRGGRSSPISASRARYHVRNTQSSILCVRARV